MTTETSHGWVPEDTLAHRLVLVRRQLGITQRVAAERCGLTFGEWQGIEDGRQVRSLDVKVAAISKALGVDRDWLIWGGPLAQAVVPARDLASTPTTPRRKARHQRGSVNGRYRTRARIILTRQSVRDDWRIPRETASHELPRILRTGSSSTSRCQGVAA